MEHPHSRYIERDSVRLHHLDWGNEGAHPIVLVHGSRLHAHVWDDFARRFRDRYHIIALDQRGHGESGWGKEDQYQLDDFYRDLRTVVETRGLKRFTLIGHSLGGRVSMTYAHHHHADLERLVLVDITPGRPPASHDPIQASEARPQGDFDSPETASDYLARRMSRAPRHLVEVSVRHGLRRMDNGRYTWRYDPAILRRIPTPVDLWGMVKVIPTPTLLQYGSDSDVVNSELAARMATTMPSCTVERVEDAGHGLFTDQPDAFAKSVERFLSAQR